MVRISLNKGKHIGRPARQELLQKSRDRERLRHRRFWSWVGIFCLLILVAGLVLIQQAFITVQDIIVRGNEITHTEDIEKIVRAEMAGSYGLVIPKKSIFFVPTAKIAETLKKEIPRIDEVSVKRAGPTKLAVTINERRADLLWCQRPVENDEVAQGNTCYFLDPSGLVIARSPNFTSGVYFEIYGAISLAEPLGSKVIDQTQLTNLRALLTVLPQVLGSINGSGYYPDYASLEKDSYLITVSSRVIGKENWTLKISSRESPSELATNLKSVLTSEAFMADYREHEGRLDYIDIRFGKKVFYKFRQ